MFDLIFSGLLFYLGIIIGKKLEAYYKNVQYRIELEKQEKDVDHEYLNWKRYRLPFLKDKMRGKAGFPDPYTSNYNVKPEYRKEQDNYINLDKVDWASGVKSNFGIYYSGNPMWALAERIARSDHKNPGWEGGKKYDF